MPDQLWTCTARCSDCGYPFDLWTLLPSRVAAPPIVIDHSDKSGCRMEVTLRWTLENPPQAGKEKV